MHQRPNDEFVYKQISKEHYLTNKVCDNVLEQEYDQATHYRSLSAFKSCRYHKKVSGENFLWTSLETLNIGASIRINLKNIHSRCYGTLPLYRLLLRLQQRFYSQILPSVKHADRTRFENPLKMGIFIDKFAVHHRRTTSKPWNRQHLFNNSTLNIVHFSTVLQSSSCALH